MTEYYAPGNRNHRTFAEQWSDPRVQSALRNSLKGRSTRDKTFRRWRLLCDGHAAGQRLEVSIGSDVAPWQALHVTFSSGSVWFVPSPERIPTGSSSRPATPQERAEMARALAAGELDPIATETHRIECGTCGKVWMMSPSALLKGVLRQISQEAKSPRHAAKGVRLSTCN